MRAGARWLVAAVALAVTVAAIALAREDKRPVDTWTVLPSAGIDGRSDPAAVWTGTAMIVWGGAGDARAMGDGASYDPVTQRWTPLPASPLGPRRAHSAVWTGDRMLVFGGQGLREGCRRLCALGDGAAFDPASGTWTPILAAAIAPRFGHFAVFVRGRMVVGGGAAEGAALGDGASYNVVTGSGPSCRRRRSPRASGTAPSPPPTACSCGAARTKPMREAGTWPMGPSSGSTPTTNHLAQVRDPSLSGS